MKLILIRHGEAITNTVKYINQYDYNFLTIKGIKQAELCALELMDRGITHFDRVITSDVLRAMQTANLILQTMDKHADYPCEKFNELEEWWKGHDLEYRVFQRRLYDWFYRELEPMWHSDQTVMMVTHGNQIKIFYDIMMNYLGFCELSEEIPHNIPTPNAMPYIIDTKKGLPPRHVVPGEHSHFYATK